MRSPDAKAERAREIVQSFTGWETVDVINTLTVALGMAICFGAQTKDDAIDMVNCIMLDYETDLPKRYDEIQKHLDKMRPQL